MWGERGREVVVVLADRRAGSLSQSVEEVREGGEGGEREERRCGN